MKFKNQSGRLDGFCLPKTHKPNTTVIYITFLHLPSLIVVLEIKYCFQRRLVCLFWKGNTEAHIHSQIPSLLQSQELY